VAGSTAGLNVTRRGAGPLVVLVHGTTPATWGELPGRLVDAGRTVLIYSRRSFPPSDTAAVGSLRQHTDDLAALIEADGGRASVVGWSIGGVIALDLAARHPECVEELVLVEAALHLKRRPTVAMIRAVVGARLRGRRDAAAGAQRFLRWALGRADGTTDLDRLDSGQVDACGEAIVAELGLGTGERELTRTQLVKIRTSVRWLVGTESQAVFTAVARRASREIRDVVITKVAGAGHALHLENPDVVVAAVTRCRQSKS